MSTNERIKRPDLERNRPIRAWSTLFGSGEHDGPSLGDVVSRSVDLGYRVVDDYVRQGQRAAQQLGERTYGPEAMVGDVQEVAGRMTQHASELLGLWLEFLDLATGANAGRRAAAGNGASGDVAPRVPASPERVAAERAAVRIEIASRRPAEVEVDLRAGPDAPLVLHGLRSADPNTPRLTDVALRPPAAAGEPWRLRVGVAAAQPAGLYTGAIVDERTSLTVGTVRVRVAES